MVIGISGKSGSGKDLFANIVNREIYLRHPKQKGYEVKKFAGKLKQIVSLLTGCSMEDLEDPEFKQIVLPDIWQLSTNSFTYRDMLIFIGTNLLRQQLDVNIWVNALFSDYVKKDGKYPNWIITDVRFVNEAEAIRERGGILVRINRLGQEPTSYSNHASETDLDDYPHWTHIIENNNSITSFENEVVTFIKLYSSILFPK